MSEHQQPDALADWCRAQAAQLAPARCLANWFAPASALTPETRLLAPTEWNFHPDGALARSVAALSPDDTDAARLLAAAYDPCVACTV